MDYETHKKKRYCDLDHTTYIFVPFVIETCGGLGDAAVAFCNELTERWKKKQCRDDVEWNKADETECSFRSKLLNSISIVVQRANSRMIL